MAHPRRPANYIATLVYVDEPQVIALSSYKQKLLAVATPHQKHKDQSYFIATTVSSKDWDAYFDENVDLRYLFTYPTKRSIYTFDFLEMNEGRVYMTLWEKEGIPDEYLPAPRFFASGHTEPFIEQTNIECDVQELQIDGEWDFPDFGDFYNRFSDVYYFVSSTNRFADATTSLETKKEILETFQAHPFRGGFSYVNFFHSLANRQPREDRLRLDKIKYESPGYVKIYGRDDTFAESREWIDALLANRSKLRKLYASLHEYLSKGKYLELSGHEFHSSDGAADYIWKTSRELARALRVPNVKAVEELVDNNALVFAKIILSVFRRLEEAARFFAQGRMNF